MKLTFLAIVLFVSTGFAQAEDFDLNRETISFKANELEVEIDYQSPGSLYDYCDNVKSDDCSIENLNARVSFNKNVVIENRHFFSGSYSIEVEKGVNRWNMTFKPLFNNGMQPVETTITVNALRTDNNGMPTFAMKRTSPDEVELSLTVGNRKLPISINRTNSDWMISSFEKLSDEEVNWLAYYQAAMYCRGYGIDHPNAKNWAEQAYEMNDNERTRRLLMAYGHNEL